MARQTVIFQWELLKPTLKNDRIVEFPPSLGIVAPSDSFPILAWQHFEMPRIL